MRSGTRSQCNSRSSGSRGRIFVDHKWVAPRHSVSTAACWVGWPEVLPMWRSHNRVWSGRVTRPVSAESVLTQTVWRSWSSATPQSTLTQSLQRVSTSADLSPGKSQDPGQRALGLLCQNQLSAESVESGASAGRMHTKWPPSLQCLTATGLSASRRRRQPDNQTDGVKVANSVRVDTSHRLECRRRIDADSGRDSRPAVSDRLYTAKRG